MQYIAYLFLISLIAVIPAGARITVTESNASRLVFVFELDAFEQSVDGEGAGAVSHLRLGDGNCELLQDDGSVVPGVSLNFGVPQEGRVTVRFVSHATRRAVLAAPPPKRDPSGAAPQELLPSFSTPWISDVAYARYRGYRTGQVFLRPVVFDAASGTMMLLEKGTCVVEFPPPGPAPALQPSLQSGYYRLLDDLLLNFDVSRMWAPARRTGLRKRAAMDGYLGAPKMQMFTVGDGSSGYNEGRTEENGIMKITGDDATMFLGQSITALALYGSARFPFDQVVPGSDSIPDGVVSIPLLRFDTDADGVFDREDYLLACVTGTSGWAYDTATNGFQFVLNRFGDDRRYWLAAAASEATTMGLFQQPTMPSQVQTSFVDRQMLRRVLMMSNREQSGTSWIWRTLTAAAPVYDQPLWQQNPVAGSDGSIRVLSEVKYGGVLSMTVGNVVVCTECEGERWYSVPSWPSDTVRLSFTDRSSDRGAYYELTGIELQYHRSISMSGAKTLQIFSSSGPNIVGYQLSGLPNEPCYLVRIPPGESGASLVAVIPAASSTYSWADTGAVGVQYFVASQSGLKTAPSMQPWYRRSASTYQLRQLRTPSAGADFLVITDSTLSTEASRLAQHKSATGQFANPKYVLLSDIFREFSGGNLEPTAIRNFLLYAVNFWTGGGPSYVVLLGGGHYDYKGYTTDEISYVPAAEFDDDCIEDYFACLDSGEDVTSSSPPSPDLFLGRLPCASEAEARIMVDKIIDMEGSGADFGPWRNRVLLVADDDMQGMNPDPISSSNPHHKSSEDVEQRILEQRRSVDIRKVYLFEYEWNEVYQKPEAARALINELNNGVSCVNYFGHGSDDRWADEGLLSPESMSSLTNGKRYPLVTSFSCSVGWFDKPGHECLSDILLKTAAAGASVSIASARKAYASDNERLGESFYRYLFEKKAACTVGQAYAAAKAENRNKNQKNYAIFGDPSLRFLLLADSVALSVHGRDGASIDTLKALQQGVTVQGSVLRAGTLNSSFGNAATPATVQIGLYNPSQDSARRKDGGTNSVTYSLPGNPVFIGQATFTSGRFQQNVFLPRNLFFNTPGVKLVAYAWYGQNAATGLREDLIFSGTEPGSVSDTAGPRITVRPIYGNQNWNSGATFTDEIVGVLPIECEISLSDSSGIDIVGTGPDEGLTIEVTNALARRNINHKFLFAAGDFRNGSATITFEEGDIEEGEHELVISAQDLLGNVSRIAVTVDVMPMSEFKIGHVFNYPNPFRMGEPTKFYFYQSNTYANDPDRSWYGTIGASIRIYALSGKLLRVLDNVTNGQAWDGTDQYGNTLAPNVYLYRVIVDVDMPEVKRTERSAIRKLVIRPPG